MLSRRQLCSSTIAAGMSAIGLAVLPQRSAAQEPLLDALETSSASPQAIVLQRHGAAWFAAQQQASGALVPGDRFAIGITALGVLGLDVEHPAVPRAVSYLLAQQQADGGVYDPREGLGLYGTALALQVCAATGAAGVREIRKMQQFLFGRQQDGDGCGDGGFSVAAGGAPDLHATSAAIDGLVATGISADDPHLKAAAAYVARCQNLGSHLPGRDWAINDGGGVYAPDARLAAGDHDDSGAPAGAIGSYGSMSHALLSSYLVMELTRDDPRVQAVFQWIGRNYGFGSHPGRPVGRQQEGIFAYYLNAAKTFRLLDIRSLALPRGGVVDWRGDLVAALSERFQATADGGCWRNSSPRWGEAMPHLCTAYALRTLRLIRGT